jgi:hypothetical protein
MTPLVATADSKPVPADDATGLRLQRDKAVDTLMISDSRSKRYGDYS